jgi:hypothetical protein
VADAPAPQVAQAHAPAMAAAALAPTRHHATPTRRRRGNPHLPVIVEQPSTPPGLSTGTAPPTSPPATPKTNGKRHGQRKVKATGKAKAQGRGRAEHQPHQARATVPPKDDSAAPPGKPDNSHAQATPLVLLPEPPGLTQTSQNPGARNDAVRHLLP